MLDLSYTTQFKRDLKLASKRGKKLKILDDIVTLLREGKPLPPKPIFISLVETMTTTGVKR